MSRQFASPSAPARSVEPTKSVKSTVRSTRFDGLRRRVRRSRSWTVPRPTARPCRRHLCVHVHDERVVRPPTKLEVDRSLRPSAGGLGRSNQMRPRRSRLACCPPYSHSGSWPSGCRSRHNARLHLASKQAEPRAGGHGRGHAGLGTVLDLNIEKGGRRNEANRSSDGGRLRWNWIRAWHRRLPPHGSSGGESQAGGGGSSGTFTVDAVAWATARPSGSSMSVSTVVKLDPLWRSRPRAITEPSSIVNERR